jgi:tape measure domain-containing protein
MANGVELGRMFVRLMGDGTSFKKMMQDAETSTGNASGEFKRQTTTMGKLSQEVGGYTNMVKGFAVSLLAMAGLGGIFHSLKSGISLASQAEENEVAFGTMLKSAEAGKEMVKQIQDLAAKTPMSTAGLQQSAKTLLQFGVEGKNVIPIMKMLGDVTGGNEEKLGYMTLAFGQMASTGRLMGQDLNQMINAGFNPLQEMARTSGRSMEYWKGEMERGRISIHQVVGALQSATKAGGSFDGLMEKQSKTVSGLFSTMQDDINASLREIGKDLIENLNLKFFIEEVSKAAQMFTTWFKSINPQTKAMTVAVMGVVAAFGLLAVAIAFAGKILNLAFGGMPLIAGLIITGIAALAGYVSYLVVRVKGLANAWDWVKTTASDAWDWVKRKAQAFWNWLKPSYNVAKEYAVAAWEWISRKAIAGWEWMMKTGQMFFDWMKQAWSDFVSWATPIWNAFVSLVLLSWHHIKRIALIVWEAIVKAATWLWDQIVYVFDSIWDTISTVFSMIVGDSEISWNKIRDYILEAFIAAEFAIENFSTLMEYFDTGAIYHIERFKNSFLFIFTDVIPAAIGWLRTEWKNIFMDMFTFTGAIFMDMAKNIGSMAKNIKKLITGELTMKDIWSNFDITKSIETKTTKFQMPKREIGYVENLLKEEFNRQGAALGISYEEFKKQKMEEYKRAGGAVEPDSVVPEDQVAAINNAAKDTGVELGKAITKGAKSELQKFDAVLATSAEAISRIAEFQEKMNSVRNPQDNLNLTGNTPTTGPTRFDAVNNLSADAATRKDNSTTLLKEIRDELKVQTREGGVKLEAANLEG